MDSVRLISNWPLVPVISDSRQLTQSAEDCGSISNDREVFENLPTSRNRTMSHTDTKYRDFIIREYSSDTPGLRFQVIYSETDKSLLLETRKHAEQLIIDRLQRMANGGKAF